MITEVHDHPEASMGTLVGGIVDDFRDLVRQEILLARLRITEDLRKTREATAAWGIGIGVLFLAGIAFCLMLANLLHTVTLPGGDPAAVPLWACHGIVGLALAIAGAAAIVAGQKKFDSIHLVDGKAAKEGSNG